MATTIAGHRAASEIDRRLAPAIVQEIRAAGLQRLTLTAENGGLEVPLPAALEIYEQLAGFDASVGWIVWNNALPCLFSRFLTPAARADIFADPAWLYASSTRPSGKATSEADGYRLSGRWSLVSGCELAEWIALTGLAPSEGADAPEMRYFFVHASELEILDTWHVGGLRGTGSHDVMVRDLLVPQDRSVSPADPSTAPGPYGCIPIIASLSLGMAAQFLGIGASALAATEALATSRVTPSAMPDMRDRQDVQAAVSGFNAALQAARGHLHARAETLWQLAAPPSQIGESDIAPVFAASSHAIRTATEAVDVLYSLAGTSAIYQSNPLERLSRDLRVMRQHVLTQPLWPEQAGRVRLGLAPDNPLFAV
jgi:alkylation response protein AidB-like acyl-CoA dehydrogenase